MREVWAGICGPGAFKGLGTQALEAHGLEDLLPRATVALVALDLGPHTPSHC